LPPVQQVLREQPEPVQQPVPVQQRAERQPVQQHPLRVPPRPRLRKQCR